MRTRHAGPVGSLGRAGESAVEVVLEQPHALEPRGQGVAVLRISGRAKQSGIGTDLTYAVVYTIRDGKIARGREYAERAEALEAAGLSG